MFETFDDEIEFAARKTAESLDELEAKLEKKIPSQKFAKRVYEDHKLSELAEYLTADGKGVFRFNGKLLLQYNKFSSFVYSYAYALDDFKIVVVQRPMDFFGNEKQDDLASDLSKLYAKFKAKTYPDYKEEYLEFKKNEEIKIFDETNPLI